MALSALVNSKETNGPMAVEETAVMNVVINASQIWYVHFSRNANGIQEGLVAFIRAVGGLRGLEGSALFQ